MTMTATLNAPLVKSNARNKPANRRQSIREQREELSALIAKTQKELAALKEARALIVAELKRRGVDVARRGV